jgi:serine/threonine protein kinase
VWSVGIIFFEMLYGRTPWIGENAFNLFENIKSEVAGALELFICSHSPFHQNL